MSDQVASVQMPQVVEPERGKAHPLNRRPEAPRRYLLSVERLAVRLREEQTGLMPALARRVSTRRTLWAGLAAQTLLDLLATAPRQTWPGTDT